VRKSERACNPQTSAAANSVADYDVALKRPQDFKLIGTPAKRLDTPAKVNGTAVYGIDVRPPGVKVATLAQSPVFGGRVKSVNDKAAKAVKGVRQIVSTSPLLRRRRAGCLRDSRTGSILTARRARLTLRLESDGVTRAVEIAKQVDGNRNPQCATSCRSAAFVKRLRCRECGSQSVLATRKPPQPPIASPITKR
jgi:hypothetical protein